jgi:hypothetical protein
MQYMGLQRLCTVLAGLWVGGFITIGYLVTPILFSALGDRQVAGMIAGNLFRLEAYLSVVLSVVLMLASNFLVFKGFDHFRVVRWILLGMLACAVGAGFILMPWMSSLRDQALIEGLSVMASSSAALFARLHRISSGVFIVQSILGIALVWHLTKS